MRCVYGGGVGWEEERAKGGKDGSREIRSSSNNLDEM